MKIEAIIKKGNIGEGVDQANDLDKVSISFLPCTNTLTVYQNRVRCIMGTLSIVNRRHFAFPLPGATSLPNISSVRAIYSSNSSSSSPGGPARLKNAHRKKSLRFSRFISSADARKNHFSKYASPSAIFLWHNRKSFFRSNLESNGGCTASR